MNLKQIRENKVFRFLSNKYVIVLVLFIVWMGFFDENSFLNQRELDEEIDKLENANEYYKKQIDADQNIIDNLNDPDSLEKYAREEYKMKRESQRLGKPVIKLVKDGGYENIHKEKTKAGAHDSQVKITSLSNDPKFEKQFKILEVIKA